MSTPMTTSDEPGSEDRYSVGWPRWWRGMGDGGHIWMALLCIPMAVLCVAAFATRFFGFGFQFAALGCVLMMALMMLPMALMMGRHGGHTSGR